MTPEVDNPPRPTRQRRPERDRGAFARATLERRAAQLKTRAAAERRRHASVAAAFELVDRDVEVGGGIIAGALAYRLFIWLLPLALVLVAGLGIAADTSSDTPEQAADSLGLAGLVSHSVADASESSARWYALAVGIFALLLATRSVLRTLIASHRLVWTDARDAAPRPTPAGTLKLLGLILAFFVVAGVVSAMRAHLGGFGLLGTILATAPFGVFWLLVSLDLPHREAPWTALLPGAVLFALGVEALHLVAVYVLTPYTLTKQGTYGALGIAAGLLVGLFLVGRLVVATAELNATLWDRRVNAQRATS